jgi:aspartokinase
MTQRIRVAGMLQNDQLASISVLGAAGQAGVAAAVLDALGRQGLNVQFVVLVGAFIDGAHREHLVICVDRADLVAALAALADLRTQAGGPVIESNAHAASVVIFGPDFRERPGIAAQMLRTLAEHGVHPLAISTSISTVNCIVAAERLAEAAAAVAEQFELP